ncbi:hypothetical protein PR048_014985 [Dryococelus australis]|uniref:Uncharacterized protein n=1 Tax=Dryococelus australis TaxID=614101 RepID=A0ABQ9HFU4_9NEOP|nr:hypothetical protein PR048_014985 [Dryococelus australis]
MFRIQIIDLTLTRQTLILKTHAKLAFVERSGHRVAFFVDPAGVAIAFDLVTPPLLYWPRWPPFAFQLFVFNVTQPNTACRPRFPGLAPEEALLGVRLVTPATVCIRQKDSTTAIKCHYALSPIPHSKVLPVPHSPAHVSVEDECEEEYVMEIWQVERDATFQASTSSSEHRMITPGELNDLVSALNLSKKTSELLVLCRKGWNFLHVDTTDMDEKGAGFLYSREKFVRVSDLKIKEGIFVGPQIRALFSDRHFEDLLSIIEKFAGNTLKGGALNVSSTVESLETVRVARRSMGGEGTGHVRETMENRNQDARTGIRTHVLPNESPKPNTVPPRSMVAQYALVARLECLCGAGMKGWGKREIPEKTCRPTESAGTIPTCENPVTRPGHRGSLYVVLIRKTTAAALTLTSTSIIRSSRHPTEKAANVWMAALVHAGPWSRIRLTSRWPRHATISHTNHKLSCITSCRRETDPLPSDWSRNSYMAFCNTRRERLCLPQPGWRLRRRGTFLIDAAGEIKGKGRLNPPGQSRGHPDPLSPFTCHAGMWDVSRPHRPLPCRNPPPARRIDCSWPRGRTTWLDHPSTAGERRTPQRRAPSGIRPSAGPKSSELQACSQNRGWRVTSERLDSKCYRLFAPIARVSFRLSGATAASSLGDFRVSGKVPLCASVSPISIDNMPHRCCVTGCNGNYENAPRRRDLVGVLALLKKPTHRNFWVMCLRPCKYKPHPDCRQSCEGCLAECEIEVRYRRRQETARRRRARCLWCEWTEGRDIRLVKANVREDARITLEHCGLVGIGLN